MPRFLFVLPAVDPEVDVRLDSDADTDSPAEVFGMGGGSAIVGSKLNAGPDGSLPHVVTVDGTDTLFVKVLDYTGTQVGDPVEVAGVDEDAAPTAVPTAAADVTYDNTTSELAATDMQAAVDEVVARVTALEGA